MSKDIMRRISVLLSISLLTTTVGISLAGTWIRRREIKEILKVAFGPDFRPVPEPIQLEDPIPNLSLCELKSNLDEYNHHVVNVHAILVTDQSGERMQLVDLTCTDHPVRIEVSCERFPEDSPFDRCQMMKEALDRFVGPKKLGKPIVANVDVVGRIVWFAWPDIPFLEIHEVTKATTLSTKIKIGPKPDFGPC